MEQKEKCCCEKSEQSIESDSSNSESSTSSKKGKIGLFNLRKSKHLHFSTKKSKKTEKDEASTSGGRKIPKWSLKFNCAKKEAKSAEKDGQNSQCCRCSCSKHSEENNGSPKDEASRKDSFDMPNDNAVGDEPSPETPDPGPPTEHRDAERQPSPSELESDRIYGTAPSSLPPVVVSAPFVDVHWLSLPTRLRAVHEDCDEAARLARAREIEQGVEPPANFRSARRVQLVYPDSDRPDNRNPQGPPRRLQLVCPPDLNVESLRALFQNHVTLMSCPLDSITGCHTQVDFIHCLVPDLLEITNCSFYWGKMDRYEAERLLDGKPEGTFLLRDSAQEEFLFSVSFRKYGRSLHARIEQWNHRFSFDSHDPGVFTSDTVCGLIEHYKDPSSCMFFEPMLTSPLHRKFVFPLQHLARAAIVSKLTYDNINHLQLPKTLKTYLKEYHYRQKVRVERFDDDVQWLELRNVPP